MSETSSQKLASNGLQADLHLVILSLPYSFLIESTQWIYETNTGLWQGQFEWSKALVPYAVLSRHQMDSIRIIDNIGVLRDTVSTLNYNGVSETNHIKLIEPQLNNQLITVSISGNENFINNCRSEILRSYDHVNYKKIALSDASFRAIGPNFMLTLNCIAARYEVEIVIGPYDTDFKSSAKPCRSNYIYILGSTEKLCFAETDVRVLVDTILAGFFVDKISIPLSMVPTLGGVNMANFAELTRESNVNVYLPYMIPSLKAQTLLKSKEDMAIWFSSKQISEVILGKKILCDLRNGVDPRHNSSVRLYTQEIRISKEKMDLLSLYFRPEILAIMFKHGTFIQVPELGELQDDIAVIQGSNIDAVEDTVLDFAALCTKLYTLELSFLQISSFPADLEYFLISLVSLKRNCILSFNGNGLRFVGGQAEIHSLINELTADINRNSLFARLIMGTDFRVLLSMELANDQKDFISGKKNGKIIKILNQVNQIPSVLFEPRSALNFIIRLSIFHSANEEKSASFKFNLLSQTVKLLELELPAERKFNIPEVFHKSIIGNGGQVIQSIMKKYNVFIKFVSFTQDNKKSDGLKTDRGKNLYSLQRGENVIIKCPMKNQSNIERAKCEIDTLVEQCCQNNVMTTYGTSVVYNTVQFKLLRSHYQLLIRSKDYDLSFINNLEKEHGTYVAFPKSIEAFKGEASLSVMIKGNDLKARLCAHDLQRLLPHTKDFIVEYNPKVFNDLINENNHEFRSNIIIPFRIILDSEIVISREENDMRRPCHKLGLSSYSRANLENGSLQLSQYLTSCGLSLVETIDVSFNPILSIEECTSPRKHSYSHKSSSRNLSPEKSHGKPRYSPNFSSSNRRDELNLVPVPFDTSPRKHFGRKSSTPPLQPITNQPLFNNSAKPHAMVPMHGLPYVTNASRF